MCNTFLINGKFMADRMQGIVRYGRQMLLALDGALSGDEDFKVELVVPCNGAELPVYDHIQVKVLGRRTGILWEQTELAAYVRKKPEAMLINLCNTAPFGVKPGITTVHDIMYRTFPENYKTFRNKISRLWHCIQYRYVFSHERVILTVSDFSRCEIEKHYPNARGKVRVIPNGWEHVLGFQQTENWQEEYPFLEDHGYYFSLATLAPSKNVTWILNTARNNPQECFALAGKLYGKTIAGIPPNVHLLGFVSDADACALIKHCRAFLYPSYAEGFGLPPLEALALGAEVICSDAASLPEVMGEGGRYFSPEDYSVDLKALLEKPRDTSSLQKYSWKKSGDLFLSLLKQLKSKE